MLYESPPTTPPNNPGYSSILRLLMSATAHYLPWSQEVDTREEYRLMYHHTGSVFAGDFIREGKGYFPYFGVSIHAKNHMELTITIDSRSEHTNFLQNLQQETQVACNIEQPKWEHVIKYQYTGAPNLLRAVFEKIANHLYTNAYVVFEGQRRSPLEIFNRLWQQALDACPFDDLAAVERAKPTKLTRPSSYEITEGEFNWSFTSLPELNVKCLQDSSIEFEITIRKSSPQQFMTLITALQENLSRISPLTYEDTTHLKIYRVELPQTDLLETICPILDQHVFAEHVDRLPNTQTPVALGTIFRQKIAEARDSFQASSSHHFSLL